MDKKLHNLLKDNIDEVILMNQQYFNMKLKPLFTYQRNSNGEYIEIPDQLEINHNANTYICFVNEKNDCIYLKHHNMAQNNGGSKMKFHLEKRNFTNWYMALKFISTNHKFETNLRKTFLIC